MLKKIHLSNLNYIKEKIIMIIIVFFYCFFQYTYLEKKFKDNNTCNKLDPFTTEKK
jgi:hypothetical protein